MVNEQIIIGGGDFAADRIIPDCIWASERKEDIIVRNPFSTRSYEHVLEPIAAYLMIAKAQCEDKKYAGNYNVEPDDSDCWITGDLVILFCDKWNKATGDSVKWMDKYDGGRNYSGKDCGVVNEIYGWRRCFRMYEDADGGI